MSRKNIVVIGGGTGTFTVLQALRDSPVNLTAIVSTADDGGSTGILRDELGVLPPGDFRQALVALADDSQVLRKLFTYRFTEGGLKGHSFGNLFISALEKVTGSFDQAILEAGKILSIQGTVLPVTTDHMRLQAETSEGKVVKGEHAIEEYIWSEGPSLQRFWVEPPCTLHPLAREALREADLIVIAPGSLYTSLVPNFLVTGMNQALASSKAPVVTVINLMTEKGQAGDFYVQDFVELIESYIGIGSIDYALYNTKLPNEQLLDRYKRERERKPVRLDRARRKGTYQVIGANLLAQRIAAETGNEDSLSATRSLIRHDGAKLARALTALLYLQEAKKYLKYA
jgi:uncharacterized cofD-like protein